MPIVKYEILNRTEMYCQFTDLQFKKYNNQFLPEEERYIICDKYENIIIWDSKEICEEILKLIESKINEDIIDITNIIKFYYNKK